jgi:hypothetical protein
MKLSSDFLLLLLLYVIECSAITATFTNILVRATVEPTPEAVNDPQVYENLRLAQEKQRLT